MIRSFFPEPGHPCEKCGVRPDIGCRHRPADATYRPPVQTEEVDRRKIYKDQGGDFRDRKIRISGGGSYPALKRRRTAV